MKVTQVLVCSLLAGCAAAPALASLGGDPTSVEADRASMKGALRVTPTVDYTVHEIQTPVGTVVREYISPQGKVFAVSWRGPGIPDLRQLLGSYYGEFDQAANSTPSRNHHHRAIRTPGVIVESSGHLRTFFGRAWAPPLVPHGFSVSQIQ